MSLLNRLISTNLQKTTEVFINSNNSNNLVCVRYASKKSGSSTRNKPIHTKPKHRGWKVQDGGYVTQGTAVVTQRTIRFHPGLNVGFGSNATLFAMESGRVMVTCEKINPNWNHTWIQGNYAGRNGQVIYKKHFNVIPEPQHKRFKLIDAI